MGGGGLRAGEAGKSYTSAFARGKEVKECKMTIQMQETGSHHPQVHTGLNFSPDLLSRCGYQLRPKGLNLCLESPHLWRLRGVELPAHLYSAAEQQS